MNNKLNLAAFGLMLTFATPALAKLPVDLSAPSSAKPGSTVSVKVKTEKGATCKIEAQDAGFTQALNLTDRKANKLGFATWRFKIPKDYKANEMPVTVTVDKNGDVEKGIKAITISK